MIVTTTIQKQPVMDRNRYAGILAHPTSFPSEYGIGDLGDTAYRFVDYLVSAGQSLWQVLPLGPTGYGDSPYQGFSAFAGQPLLISPDRLEEEGLLKQEELDAYPRLPSDYVDYGAVMAAKNELFHKAYERFCELDETNRLKKGYERFCREQAFWLAGYALFMALKDTNEGRLWLEWEDKQRNPSAEQMSLLAEEYREQADYYRVIQFLFFEQWHALKTYANENGIKIVGDIPIFVSLDSSDVWAAKEMFQLDEEGYPVVVAGVPPDYFSETGQLWGNPLYDWKNQEKDGFKWWIARIRSQLGLVDYIRIDHFRGFDSYWAVPYGAENAVHGKWMEGPKEKLFLAVQKEFGENLPIWAEDLGVITEDVEKLRDEFHFPGMKILQFAFEDERDNDMMPEHHIPNCICYTGTHDNDTTLGWYRHLGREDRKRVSCYMHTGAATVSWAFIRTALESVADYVVVPLQDVMSLDSEARMNTPGKAWGNWSWRFHEKQLDEFWAAYLKELTDLYGRQRKGR